MENKINVAELLKDCQKGMELDCSMYDNAKLDSVDNNEKATFPIRVLREDGNFITLTKYGQYINESWAKCVIFPLGKTTWEGFVSPCNFKDGDIVFYYNTIAIFKEWGDETLFRTYVVTYLHCDSFIDVNVPLFGKSVRKEIRLATEEEKQKLFRAIKENGYEWNAETKTLKKLIKPKFKVGDKIRHKDDETVITITGIKDDYYFIQFYNVRRKDYQNEKVSFKDQDQYELIPNKFDINTLKPFESRVLVRDCNLHEWEGEIFTRYTNNLFNNCIFVTLGGRRWKQCIPYEGNEHLCGTANDCDDFYKTWE